MSEKKPCCYSTTVRGVEGEGETSKKEREGELMRYLREDVLSIRQRKILVF